MPWDLHRLSTRHLVMLVEDYRMLQTAALEAAVSRSQTQGGNA